MTDINERRLDALELATAGLNADELAVLNGVVAGTATAEKAVVLGTSKEIDTIGIATITGVANRVPVALTATVALTAALNANRVNYITGTAAAAYTLPEATGTGNSYIFFMGEVNTNGTTFVTPDLVNSLLYGKANMLDVDATAATAFFTVTAGDTNTVTFDGTTKGGQIGDIVTITDLATDVFAVHVESRVPAGQNVASPFSAA